MNNFIKPGSIPLLLLAIAIPIWGQEHPSETPEIAPVPELIDVWDTSKVSARRPLLIAHRGGVVAPGVPECYRMAVKMAAAHRYDMVELDVRESRDHHPVVFHDRNMRRACGIEGEISDFTLDSLTQIRFHQSDEAITSLDAMLSLCRSLNLGVMFDIKSSGESDLLISRILDLIEKYNLERACILLADSLVQERMKGKVLSTLPDKTLENIKQGESADLYGFYWFGVPKAWWIDLIKPVQQAGALVIPAINTFRYSRQNHRSEARKDIERLLEAGVDGFQIDCIYQDYLDRPKIQ